MAVTPVLTPDVYALTKGGRMRYRFSGSGRYETGGVKAACGLTLKAAVADGTLLKLRWAGVTQTLTARTVPVLPSDFPAGDGSHAHGQALADYFNAYFPFRADFRVTKVDFGIWTILNFVARRSGAAYTMSLVSPPGIAGLPGPTPPLDFGLVTAGADARLRDRYGVYLELYLQRAGTAGASEDDFDLIATPHVECDDDGVCEFDCGDVLHGYLQADIPDFTAQGGQLAPDSHRAYYVAYGEAWGQPVRPGKIISDSIRHAYLGGADFAHRGGVGFDLSAFLLGNAASTDHALRFGTTTRALRIDEPQFLTFLNLRSADSVSLQVVLTFDDDSTENMTGIQAVIPYAPGAKVCFPVGVALLDLLSQVPAGKFLKEYQVSLFGQAGGVLSRPYRFIVEYDLPPYRRYLAYLNSLGAFSTLMTYGKGSAELQRFYDQSEKWLPAGYEPTDAQYVDYNSSLQQQFEVASGWQREAELQSWNDFYRSPIRLLVSAQTIYAIGLTNKTIKQATDGDRQFAHALTLLFLHRDEFYTDTDTPDGDEPTTLISPAGSVVVSPMVVTPVFDPSIPAAVRALTTADIAAFKLVAARPNPETLGFLNQSTASTLFRRNDQPIPYTDLDGTPSTRDEAGLTDVPTRSDIFSLIHVTAHLSSWTGATEPDEL